MFRRVLERPLQRTVSETMNVTLDGMTALTSEDLWRVKTISCSGSQGILSGFILPELAKTTGKAVVP